MHDYSFGNTLLQLRRRAGMTQKELAQRLNVTDKAVSKWENGRAKPTTDTLRKLAALLGVSPEDLLREPKPEPAVTKIVITGGPCAGKSTAMSWIQNAFSQMGYAVLFVPETATELITGGVAPWTCRDNLSYQKCQMQLQMEKERVFGQAARCMPQKRVLIVCDRGTMDNRAYMTEAEFACVCAALGQSETALRDTYDAVFHLVTAAKGAEAFYTTANNAARTETPQQAAALDDRLIAAWTGHPHLRVLDNSTDFSEKMKRLIREISLFLGEPEPCEIERKFLIAYPDIRYLESLSNCRKVEILQTYLQSPDETEIRVRQRGCDGHYTYTQTSKRPVSSLRRMETERRLTQEEYLQLLMNADPARHPLRKTRYCLTEGNRYFEIDLYPFWRDRAILEIELSDEGEEIFFPKGIQVIREVTGEAAYRNAALAENPDPSL